MGFQPEERTVALRYVELCKQYPDKFPDSEFKIKTLGEIGLRGKTENLELYTITK